MWNPEEEGYDAYLQRVDPEHAMKNGVWYTPVELTDAMVRMALEVAEEVGVDLTEQLVWEPSAGQGAFLAALERAGMCLGGEGVLATELLDAPAAELKRRFPKAEVSVQSGLVKPRDSRPVGLVIGNPPYGKLQGSRGWLDDLRLPGTYERLHTVFLRVAMWRAWERNFGSGGVVAMVVPSASFGTKQLGLERWLRSAADVTYLLDLDLGGSLKDSWDKSVFAIGTSTTVIVAGRSHGPGVREGKIFRGSIKLGELEQKLEDLRMVSTRRDGRWKRAVRFSAMDGISIEEAMRRGVSDPSRNWLRRSVSPDFRTLDRRGMTGVRREAWQSAWSPMIAAGPQDRRITVVPASSNEDQILVARGHNLRTGVGMWSVPAGRTQLYQFNGVEAPITYAASGTRLEQVGPDPLRYLLGMAGPAFSGTRYAAGGSQPLHLPVTKDAELWMRSVELGRRVWALQAADPREPVDLGSLRVESLREDASPLDDHLDELLRLDGDRLDVGGTVISGVPKAALEFRALGSQVVKEWLKKRIARPFGKPGDDISRVLPDRWYPEWSMELVRVVALAAAHAEIAKEQDAIFRAISESECWQADEFEMIQVPVQGAGVGLL